MDNYDMLRVLRQKNGSEIERIHHVPIGPFCFVAAESRRLLHQNLSNHLGVNTVTLEVA
jgi:hypothetical protein